MIIESRLKVVLLKRLKPVWMLGILGTGIVRIVIEQSRMKQLKL